MGAWLNKRASRAAHTRIPLLYLIWAGAYIVISTLAFGVFFDYGPGVASLEIAKGIAFVVVTALILWAVLRHQLRSDSKHEARFYSLVENLPDAVFLVRIPGRTIVYANPAARRMFGFEDEELVGSSSEILHVDRLHFSQFDAAAPNAFAPGDSVSLEFEMRRKNGEIFPTSHVVSMFSGDEDVSYALSVVRDDSERRMYETRLRESEERLRQIAENLREVLWISDPDKSVIYYANPAYELVWGRKLEELYACPSSFLDAVHPEDRAWVTRKAARQAYEEYDIRYRIERPDGEVRWIWDRAVPIRGDDGTVKRIVGIAEDITDLRRQEAELRQAQKMEAVGQLTGGIAHDFNNLLTVILGNAESLRGSVPEDSEDQQDLKAIISASRRAAALTQRLLAFSRQQVLSSDRVDLNVLVQEMTELLRRTLGEQVEIETRLEPGLASITADRAQLETSIMNLAINARDAMLAGGHITLETDSVTIRSDSEEARWRDIAPGEYVRLRVSDTGHGMAPAVAAKVFDPFFTTKELGKGTGLGLSTVYGFVKQSGGAVNVRSSPGLGAVFEVLLPRHVPGAAAGGGELADPQPLPKGDEKVLVVEDDPMVRAFTVNQLRELGYSTLDACAGSEALDVLDAHRDVALLFTDVVMPGSMSGPELAAAAQQRDPALKVLFTSGYAEAAYAASVEWPSTIGLLSKPYTPRQLAYAVRGAVDGSPFPRS